MIELVKRVGAPAKNVGAGFFGESYSSPIICIMSFLWRE
jgi:hypothetical protein